MVEKTLLAITAIIFITVITPGPSLAVYDPLSVPNNKFGIHILDPGEIDRAAQLVNSGGGDWGYVTIPIRANDRDLQKWTEFMTRAREKHLIPILRIASFPVQPPSGEPSHWMAPNEYDLVDFANFLDELSWPTQNRYVIVYNEPNHDSEWSGFVYPAEYARVLDRAVDIFHKRNPDFFVIAAGLDSSAPDSTNSLNEYSYLAKMDAAWPGVFTRVDGFSSHAYGNPGFVTGPNIFSRVNIANYRFEQNYLCQNFSACDLKVFLTEAGWVNPPAGWYREALTNIWTDANIVAVTPFLLNASAGPFTGFSFLDPNGNWKNFAQEIMALPKSAGRPQLAPSAAKNVKISPSWTGNKLLTFNFDLIVSLKQIFSLIFNREK